jgi:hypothetical protein
VRFYIVKKYTWLLRGMPADTRQVHCDLTARDAGCRVNSLDGGAFTHRFQKCSW